MKADPDDVPGLNIAVPARHAPPQLIHPSALENRHRRSASVQQIVQQIVQQLKFDSVQRGAIPCNLITVFR
jgi:hypothetical protein